MARNLYESLRYFCESFWPNHTLDSRIFLLSESWGRNYKVANYHFSSIRYWGSCMITWYMLVLLSRFEIIWQAISVEIFLVQDDVIIKTWSYLSHSWCFIHFLSRRTGSSSWSSASSFSYSIASWTLRIHRSHPEEHERNTLQFPVSGG